MVINKYKSFLIINCYIRLNEYFGNKYKIFIFHFIIIFYFSRLYIAPSDILICVLIFQQVPYKMGLLYVQMTVIWIEKKNYAQ